MWKPGLLPLKEDVETKSILKKLPKAHSALAELKGRASSIPNQTILINTLTMQEAKDSSAVENIITTHDALYKAELKMPEMNSIAIKEVQNYVSALRCGFELVRRNKLITNNYILEIHKELEKNNSGFRKLPGTDLKNQATGQIIYTPPQDRKEIESLMQNLEVFINDDSISDLDPLVKMAIIHFQFESIHPFYDGNGRAGRIINILYLIKQELLHLPILYLSRYVIQNKSKYYSTIQDVRDSGNWENWIIYILDAVEKTATQTVSTIQKMSELMLKTKHRLRDNYKFYSQDLINNLFTHPYTKIEFLQEDLKVTRITAANYLNRLSKDGILQKLKYGRSNYYVNIELVNILVDQDPL